MLPRGIVLRAATRQAQRRLPVSAYARYASTDKVVPKAGEPPLPPPPPPMQRPSYPAPKGSAPTPVQAAPKEPSGQPLLEPTPPAGTPKPAAADVLSPATPESSSSPASTAASTAPAASSTTPATPTGLAQSTAPANPSGRETATAPGTSLASSAEAQQPAPGQASAGAGGGYKAPPPPPRPSRVGTLLYRTILIAGGAAFAVYLFDSRAGIHRWVILPAIMALTQDDPEKAHELAVRAIASGLAPKDRGVDDDVLALELWGREFSNPIGIAAGWDKHGEAIDGLFGLGFGYVEIGSVTPEPQPGNPKPRLFRIPEASSVLNRYGFNSEGHAAVLGRLKERVSDFISSQRFLVPSHFLTPAGPLDGPDYDPVGELLATAKGGKEVAVTDELGIARSLQPGKVLALNLGKNKTSDPDSIDDFLKGVKAFGPYADVLVVNVSSPNTPGLRDLQRRGMLDELLGSVVRARNDLTTAFKPPVLVKVAPDLTAEQIGDIAAAVKESGIDGVIVSNTTISRPPTAGTSTTLLEAGGLSGPPVKPLALKALQAFYEATDGKVPLVGCGGISSGQDAIDYAKAGASFVQLYTSLVYQGPGVARFVKDEVTEILKKEGKTWKDLVGSGVPKKKLEVGPERPKPAVPVQQALETDLLKLLGHVEGLKESVVTKTEEAKVAVAKKATGTTEKVKESAKAAAEKAKGKADDTVDVLKKEYEELLAQVTAYESGLKKKAGGKKDEPAAAAPTADAKPSVTSQHAVSASTTPSATASASAAPSSGVVDPKQVESMILDPAAAQLGEKPAPKKDYGRREV